MALLEKQTQIFRRFHPNDRCGCRRKAIPIRGMEEFLNILREGVDWLTAWCMAVGLWVRSPGSVNAIPRAYPIRNYPRHHPLPLDCQLPVPDWTWPMPSQRGVRLITRGRWARRSSSGISSRPPSIPELFEGCHDDVNKIVWSRLGGS